MKKYWLGFFAAASLVPISGAIGSTASSSEGKIRALEEMAFTTVPTFPKPTAIEWLPQGWDPARAAWFHHANQGTQTFPIPYEWFMALEHVGLPGIPGELLSNQDYLDRYGFMRDDSPESQGLPIGLARGDVMLQPDGTIFRDARTDKPLTAIGLTCAACHTGRLVYHGTEMRIDGAPAMTNLKLFQTRLLDALGETRLDPLRRKRFASRVLGKDADASATGKLIAQMDRILTDATHVGSLEDGVQPKSVKEGFGRLDALNRIGNMVFSLDQGGIKENYAPTSAPVHFPRIWDTSWFLWVQYDGSIEQPMVRNAGEALGVSAPLTLMGPKETLFKSGVPLKTLYEMERMLAGDAPYASRRFDGLKPPVWPDKILPPINTALASEGAKLYSSVCQSCHLPPVNTAGFWESKRWVQLNNTGDRFLDLEMVSIDHVGTDPGEAAGIATRTVTTAPDLQISDQNFGLALRDVVGKVIDKWYDTQTPPTPQSTRDEMNGNRPNEVRAPFAYKARPLDGIWATAPYLHNGSVPTLYDLLSPHDDRPRVLYLGSREFDPVKVGIKYTKFKGATEIDTRTPGNLSSGHEFSNTAGKGVVGPALSPDQRRALVEYLKTL